MTKKTFTEREVSDILREVMSNHIQYFVDSRMTFSEFSIVQSLMTQIQNEFMNLKKE